MDSDPELEAIRARLRQEITAAAAAAEAQAEAAPALDRPIDIGDADFQRFVQEHPFVVVDLWAPWCGPCRIVGPIIDELAREMAGRVAFGKLNVDENPGVPQAFAVQGIPTLLVFQNGRLADRIVGALPKAQLAARLERLRGPGRTGAVGPRR